MWYFGQDIYELITTLSLENPQIKGSELETKLFDYINKFQKIVDESHHSDEILVIAVKE